MTQSMIDLFEDYLIAQIQTSKQIHNNNTTASDPPTSGLVNDPQSSVPYSPMTNVPQPFRVPALTTNVNRNGCNDSDNKENKAEFVDIDIEYSTDELFSYMDEHFGELVCLVEDETTKGLYVPYATDWIKQLVYASMKSKCPDTSNKMDVDIA